MTPEDMVPDTRVSLIEASPHDVATAYVAAKRNQMDDRAPYIWKTKDFGRSWTRIEKGIRSDDFVHAIREDPRRAGLLYAGTEHGVYVSFDHGASFSSLSLNLPDVQVPDLVVEERDLVIATHGRSFYVLDDIAPLRQLSPAEPPRAIHLFRPSDAVRRVYSANFDIYLDEPEEPPLQIQIRDRDGALIRELPVRRARAGLNRVSWDLRYFGATVFEGMVLESPSPDRGPWAPPGEYEVRFITDNATLAKGSPSS